MCRVVSFPAVVSRMNIVPNSCSLSREPSSSASTSLVVMSSRGSRRRASPRARPYSIRSRENGLENGSMRSSGSRSARSATYSSPTTSGSVFPRSLSPSSMISRRSSTGRPMISEKTHIGSSAATDSTQSNSASLDGGLEDVARESADPLLVRVHDARCEALVDERAHARVRGRVGVDHRAARRELLRRQILERGAAELRREGLPLLGDPHDVLVARDHPEARPLVLGLPVERCIPAEQGEPVVGDASLPHVEVGQVDVVEREPVERGARDRRLRGR